MNPLLINQNFLILRTINSKKLDGYNLVIINEFESFLSLIENEKALKIFGNKETQKSERINYARNLLIQLIGKKEFNRLKESFENKPTEMNLLWLKNMLTDAEYLLFKLLAKDFNQSEIAELLEWSVEKIELHQKSIYHKMNFSDKAELLEYANKNFKI